MRATIFLRRLLLRTLRLPHDDDDDVRLRTGSLSLDLAVTPLVIIAIWLSIGFDLSAKRAAVLAGAMRDSADLTYAAAANVSQAMVSVDQALLSLRADYAAAPDTRGLAGFDLARWSRLRFTETPAFNLILIDRSGRQADTGFGPTVGQTNPGDWTTRPEFQAPRDSAADRLFIGTSASWSPDRRSLRFSRKLFGPSGSFDGVAVMAVDPAWLSRTYGALDEGSGFFLLAGSDATVLAAAPTDALDLGSNVARLDLFAAATRAPTGTLETTSLNDGVARIASYRQLADYPLVVAVGLDRERALAAYRSARSEYFAAGAALTLCMLLLGALLVDHKRRLLLSQRDLQVAVENISQGIALIDGNGRVPVLNRRAIELCGLSDSYLDRLAGGRGITASELAVAELDPAGADPMMALQHDGDASLAAPLEFVYERQRADGVVMEVRTRRLAGGGVVRTFTDITQRRRAEEQIRRLAHYDSLTGLANRHLLYDELERALAEAAGGGSQLAVIFLDLDRFKAVNDTLGHAAGDHVLKEVACRLRETAGAHGIIARLGGDEFVVVQTGLAQPAGSLALARRLIERVSAPYDIAGQPVSVGTSVGIAVPSAAGEGIDRLLSNADAALYLAKSDGRGTVRVFDREMDEQRHGRRELVRDLRAAITAAEIEVYYQPIFLCASGEIVGFEALARWTHPVLGAIPPGEFIPLAEEHGLIQTLGRLVLRNACGAALSWPERTRVVVNLSPAQVRGGNLAQSVAEVLLETGLPARRLELEVAERVLIENTDQALGVFQALGSLGVRVALDDFGTGYSSLAYLRLFPFDKIKIDGTFIRALETDPGAGTIVQAILGMGRTLQVKVAAKGVESELQLAILRQQKCSEVQGHFLGHPGPLHTLGRFFNGDRPARAARIGREMVKQAS